MKMFRAIHVSPPNDAFSILHIFEQHFDFSEQPFPTASMTEVLPSRNTSKDAQCNREVQGHLKYCDQFNLPPPHPSNCAVAHLLGFRSPGISQGGSRAAHIYLHPHLSGRGLLHSHLLLSYLPITAACLCSQHCLLLAAATGSQG